MALHEIPVLEEDYPLFDWADWPNSDAALVQGGPTKNFEMACWNAIVSHLAEALDAAGEEWYTGATNSGAYGYSVEDTKITDGILRSRQMNRVVSNIYSRVPLQTWLWVADSEYRGYTGTLLFRQAPARPGHDKVYPEYFRELVYRLNQMIEIMRGTWPITEAPEIPVKTALLIQPGARAGTGAPIIHEQIARTTTSLAPLDVIPGQSGAAEIKFRSKTKAKADYVFLRAGSANVKIPLLINASVQYSIATSTAWKAITRSLVSACPESFRTLDVGLIEMVSRLISGADLVASRSRPIRDIRGKLASKACAQVLKKPGRPTEASSISVSKTPQTAAGKLPSLPMEPLPLALCSLKQAEANATKILLTESKVGTCSVTQADGTGSKSLPTGAEQLSGSPAEAGVVPGVSAPLDAGHCSAVSRAVTILKGKTRPGWAEGFSRTGCSVETDSTVRSIAASASVGSASGVRCKLDTGWLPPVWVDGGLWIRQAYNVVQQDDGSLEVD